MWTPLRNAEGSRAPGFDQVPPACSRDSSAYEQTEQHPGLIIKNFKSRQVKRGESLTSIVIDHFSDLGTTCSPCLFCPIIFSSSPCCLSSPSCCSLQPGKHEDDKDGDENDDHNASKSNHVVTVEEWPSSSHPS